ncbi:hypothetical protein ASF58_20855 [Methylobacterium sp. Leaf125]|uniref:hypothetical protein n=1 Tax=Methylobacterium sp. Leaf125 TaxID=1736265 RepID=UPI0006F515F0|nr:hypothetical protein [Methylobacterium sp. Leaf125]KQQ44389.1 hypothetical protein ASF58_20855 [Methylobacterium sp. Leaf125]
MTIITEHTDGQRVTEDGHGVRFILPARRHDRPVTRGVCTDRLFNGRKVRTFSIQAGDVSSEEARNYAGRLEDAPARAMAVFDTSKADVRGPGQKLRASFTVNVRPGLLMTHDWCGICQYNARPNPAERWRNPPFAIGMKPRGRNSREEVFYVDLATFPTAGSQEQGRHVDLGPKAIVPFKRDRPYAFEIEFMDGAGGDGLLKVSVDGSPIVDYVGPTGYANYAGCFFAYGLYRSCWCPGCEGLTANFEHVTEGAVS